MKDKSRKIINSTKEDSNKESSVIKTMARIYIELQKTDIYYIPVDVLANPDEDFHKENASAIKIAWSIINGKLIDPETLRIGDSFSTKILKREYIEAEISDPGPTQNKE